MRTNPTTNISVVEKSRDNGWENLKTPFVRSSGWSATLVNGYRQVSQISASNLISRWQRTSRSAIKSVPRYRKEENQESLQSPTELIKSRKIENLRKDLSQRDQHSSISSTVNDMTLPESQATYSDPKWPLVSQFFKTEFPQRKTFSNKRDRIILSNSKSFSTLHQENLTLKS